jgi:Amt family ammonium transporter
VDRWVFADLLVFERTWEKIMSENITWMLLAGILVVLMQGGFILVISGLCRAKNAGQVVSMNFMILPLSVIGFWICGFVIMFGGDLHNPNTISQWLPLRGQLQSPGFEWITVRLFFYQAAVVAVAAAIPAGVMAERWRFSNFVIYGFWVGALPIAVFGRWVWGGGGLAQLGQTFNLGHGYVDFAGSSVVHMSGGVIGLAGAALLGPRLGKYSREGRPRPMPGHNLVYLALGTFILAIGWFGFNLAPALAEAHERVAVIAVNTLLAAATGTVGAYVVVITKYRKPDPSMLCNGMLAGLVAISGPCAFVNSAGAVIIGIVAGVLVVYSVIFFEAVIRLDDPVGAVSVHGVSGAWGVLSLGLFANGSYGMGWNGIHATNKTGQEMGVAGAFGTLFGSPANDWSQLGAQAVGALTCLLFMGAFSWLWFKLSGFVVPMRSKREDEMSGLDLPEMGAECYPDFHLTDQGSARGD